MVTLATMLFVAAAALLVALAAILVVNLYDKNLEYLGTLDLFIRAGNMKLKELNQEVLPELQRKAAATGDPLDAQKFKDFEQLANRFEKKLHDLKLSRMIAI